jgi:hypothetical protein
MGSIPHDTQNDPPVRGISLMMMASPTTGNSIEFNIARPRLVWTKLDESPQKIGTGFSIPKSRMKNLDLLPVTSRQLVPQKPLMPPDLLHPKLGRRSAFAKGW